MQDHDTLAVPWKSISTALLHPSSRQATDPTGTSHPTQEQER